MRLRWLRLSRKLRIIINIVTLFAYLVRCIVLQILSSGSRVERDYFTRRDSVCTEVTDNRRGGANGGSRESLRLFQSRD